MTDTTTQTFPDGPPRLFWRRALAFLVDATLCFVAVNIVILALNALSPWDLGFGAYRTTACQLAPQSEMARQVDREWPLEYGYVRMQTLCRTSILFDSTQYSVTVSTAKQIGFAARTVTVSFPTDETGAPLKTAAPALSDWLPALAPYIPFVAMVLLFIHFSAGGRTSPGKRLLKLRIATPWGTSVGLDRAARRELLKFAPLVIGNLAILLFTLVAMLQGPLSPSDVIAAARTSNDSAETLQLASFGAGGALLLWWFLPFILWRGQTFYDRFTDCVVLRR